MKRIIASLLMMCFIPAFAGDPASYNVANEMKASVDVGNTTPLAGATGEEIYGVADNYVRLHRMDLNNMVVDFGDIQIEEGAKRSYLKNCKASDNCDLSEFNTGEIRAMKAEIKMLRTILHYTLMTLELSGSKFTHPVAIQYDGTKIYPEALIGEEAADLKSSYLRSYLDNVKKNIVAKE